MFKLGSKERKVSTKIKECKTKNCINSTFYKNFDKLFENIVTKITKNPNIYNIEFYKIFKIIFDELQKIKCSKKYKTSQDKYDKCIIKCYQAETDKDIKVFLKLSKRMIIYTNKQLKLNIMNKKLILPHKKLIKMKFILYDNINIINKYIKG